MSDQLTPSKRQHDEDFGESDEKGKLQKLTGSYPGIEPFKSSSRTVEFRLLCPVSKIDGVLGKDGSFVSQILRETGASLTVEELVPGCDERVVIIGFDKGNGVNAKQSGDDNGKEASVKEKHDEGEEQSGETVHDESSKSNKGNSSLQTALLLVFDRMVGGEKGTERRNDEEKQSSTFSSRVLVPSSQIGCVLGKGGSQIKKMASESGAQIRIVPRDKVPPCVSDFDELVQIAGEGDAVRKGIQYVSSQLLGNSSHGPDSFTANISGLSSNSHGQSHPRVERFPQSNRSFGARRAGAHNVDYHSAGPPLIPRFHEGGFHGRMKLSQEILSFRLLCHSERLGGVIGKGGQVIRTVQQDTGCEVKILEGVPNSDDRIIVISGPVHPDDRISAVQDAVLRVQTRIARALPGSKEQGLTARLLVSSNQIGCLLGKGGSVMAEMRKLSRAHIRILAKNLIPKCALEEEEVVQINGEFEAVQEALVHITTRLQHYFFRHAFPSMNFPPNPAFLNQPPYPSFFGRRELSPPGMYSNYGPPLHKFDRMGIRPPHAGFHPHDDYPPFMHNIPRFDHPTHISDRRPWGSQGLLDGGGPGLPEFVGGPYRTPGFGGDNHPTLITCTTIEVVVPRFVVPEIYGEDGQCLKQIREISDAKITISEPKPGASETAIIISGTPEQTHAAQSLIQAFVIIETEST